MNPSGWDAVVLGIHVAAAAIWVGGSIALGAVALGLRGGNGANGPDRSALIGEIARRLEWVLWPALLVAIVTGAANLSWYLPAGVPYAQLPQAPYLSAKVAVVAALVLVTSLHSFAVAPAVRGARTRGAPSARRLARLDVVLGILSAGLGVAVLMLAAQLDRF
jgi:uncharacterized membrane protein